MTDFVASLVVVFYVSVLYPSLRLKCVSRQAANGWMAPSPPCRREGAAAPSPPATPPPESATAAEDMEVEELTLPQGGVNNNNSSSRYASLRIMTT